MEITLNDLKLFKKSDLDSVLKEKDKNNIISFLNKFGLCIKDKKIYPKDEYKDIWNEAYKYFDKQQLIKKILLNSA
jgi:hypothetical protein